MHCCSCFILSFYPSLDFWLLLSILFFLGYYTVYSPPAYDLFCSSAYTVAFRLISNQMIPVFTGGVLPRFQLHHPICQYRIKTGIRFRVTPAPHTGQAFGSSATFRGVSRLSQSLLSSTISV